MATERIHIVDTPEEASEAIARQLTDLIRAAAGEDRETVLGLATGETMDPLYGQLVRLHADKQLSFDHVWTFNLDEYCGIEAFDPRSFRSQMRRKLFDHVHLGPARARVPDGSLALRDPIGYCHAWEQAIRYVGGLDMQVLGLGRNGHVAFNEPGCAVGSRTRLVKLSESTREAARAGFGGLDKVPTQAVTAGLATIRSARRIRLLAFGESKAPAVRRMLTEPTSRDLPASLLLDHADMEVWLDRAAASALDLPSPAED